jgi:DNA-binding transcriptional LysR family regulator
MLPTNLDMDVLRTFMTGMDLGSFAQAAARLGRSPSAISLQLRKLEEQAGQPLFRKQGRGLSLTDAGETLLSYTRRLLDLNDEALMALRGPAVAGWVRLGLPQDLAETWLPNVLARFTRLHPNVRVQALVDRNAALLDSFGKGDLDLVLAWGEAGQPPHEGHLTDLPMTWVGPPGGFVRDPREPLPLVAFGPPCIFRQAGVAALDAAGISWRIAFSSPSLSGLWAAVAAGLGVTLRTAHGMPVTLSPLDPEAAGLPMLPHVGLSLRTTSVQSTPAVSRLAAILRETLEQIPIRWNHLTG